MIARTRRTMRQPFQIIKGIRKAFFFRNFKATNPTPAQSHGELSACAARLPAAAGFSNPRHASASNARSAAHSATRISRRV